MQYTTNLNLNMPELDDVVDIGKISENFEILDKNVMLNMSNVKNLIIDGGFQIWEEDVSFLVEDDFTGYTATMWYADYKLATAGDVQISQSENGVILEVKSVKNSGIRYLDYKVAMLEEYIGKTVTISYSARKLTASTTVATGDGYIAPTTTEFATYTQTMVLENDIRIPIITNSIGDGIEVEWIMLNLGSTNSYYTKESYNDARARTLPYFEQSFSKYWEDGTENYEEAEFFAALSSRTIKYLAQKRVTPTITIFSPLDKAEGYQYRLTTTSGNSTVKTTEAMTVAQSGPRSFTTYGVSTSLLYTSGIYHWRADARIY